MEERRALSDGDNLKHPLTHQSFAGPADAPVPRDAAPIDGRRCFSGGRLGRNRRPERNVNV